MTNALSIENFSLSLKGAERESHLLDQINIEIRESEIVGLVGESGSGKSVTSLSVMGLMEANNSVLTSGRISVLGRDVLSMGEAELRTMRGARMAMIFQEPMTALNPVKRIGDLMIEVIRTHRDNLSRADARSLAAQLLEDMRIHDVARVLRAYPFELSGGMRQRVLIAIAFSCRPGLIIADEPTTALDVTVQAQILSLLRDMAQRSKAAVLFISHDLGVVSELCERLYVIRDGRILESGPTAEVLQNPQADYTKALLRALPEFGTPGQPLPVDGQDDQTVVSSEVRTTDPDTPSLLEVCDLDVSFRRKGKNFWSGSERTPILKKVNFSLLPGRTVGIIGESGSGKSTLARAIGGLVMPDSGSILFKNQNIAWISPKESRSIRKDMHIVFQDPRASLNPRMRVWEIMTEPLLAQRHMSRDERRDRAAQLALEVGLPGDAIDRFPHAFSGGQRQRIALGRALATEPDLIILDEPTSALDVSIQAQILNLLLRLQIRRGLSYLFISHDVSVIRHIADDVLVMNSGEIVESGPAQTVLNTPRHPYTRQLISAVPKVMPGVQKVVFSK